MPATNVWPVIRKPLKTFLPVLVLNILLQGLPIRLGCPENFLWDGGVFEEVKTVVVRLYPVV